MNTFVDNNIENGQNYDGTDSLDQKYAGPPDFAANASCIWRDGHSIAGRSEQHISNLSSNSDCNVATGTAVNADNYVDAVSPNAETYDRLIQMIKGLDLQDDGITMNHKIKSIEVDYCRAIVDEDMLCESMDYINGKALDDGDIALKFAVLFASRNFDALAMKDTKIRNAMLTLLEKNFTNADLYRSQNKKRLYNSITLLGEYYHRVRVANDSPIKVLGESLLRLLIDEVSLRHNANDLNLAKLVLSQITLNGSIMRGKHQAEIAQLLFQIRKNLIEQPTLKANVKAIFLMTLDLYYNNFNCLGTELEQMYTNYYMMEDDDIICEAARNQCNIPPTTEIATYIDNALHQANCVTSSALSHKFEDHKDYGENRSETEFNISAEYNEYLENDVPENEEHNTKWSEQLGEDCFLNNIISNFTTNGEEIVDIGHKTSVNCSFAHKPESSESQCSIVGNLNNKTEYKYNSSRRSRQPQERESPKSLKESRSNTSDNRVYDEEDDSKPLPRWRTTRFGRNDHPHGDGNTRPSQRYSRHNHQDDQHSVRSDNENIRLYSINDRLKHDHDKIARAGHSSHYDAIINSNWDRRSQRDDRSERSYLSNYERGSQRRGIRLYNNRSTYNKPPRFQKNCKNTNINSNASNQVTADDKKFATVSWRHSGYNKFSDLDINSHNNHGELQQSTLEKHRSRTLPRMAKSRTDQYLRSTPSNSLEESVNHNRKIGNKHDRTRVRSFNNRHSSQDNFDSELSSSNLEAPLRRSEHKPQYKNTTAKTLGTG